jgi:hypothetical protein
MSALPCQRTTNTITGADDDRDDDDPFDACPQTPYVLFLPYDDPRTTHRIAIQCDAMQCDASLDSLRRRYPIRPVVSSRTNEIYNLLRDDGSCVLSSVAPSHEQTCGRAKIMCYPARYYPALYHPCTGLLFFTVLYCTCTCTCIERRFSSTRKATETPWSHVRAPVELRLAEDCNCTPGQVARWPSRVCVCLSLCI